MEGLLLEAPLNHPARHTDIAPARCEAMACSVFLFCLNEKELQWESVAQIHGMALNAIHNVANEDALIKRCFKKRKQVQTLDARSV